MIQAAVTAQCGLGLLTSCAGQSIWMHNLQKMAQTNAIKQANIDNF